MSGLTWLNDLMTWLARWVPRLTLIKATHQGVLFGPNGHVSLRMPGLMVYWPITHELVQVSTRVRTMELAAQLHDREAIQIVVCWRIAEPVTALMGVNDVAAQMDDRAQAALCAAYQPSRTSDTIATDVLQRLRVEWQPLGVVIESVDVSQRGPTFTLKMLNDWAVHEAEDYDGLAMALEPNMKTSRSAMNKKQVRELLARMERQLLRADHFSISYDPSELVDQWSILVWPGTEPQVFDVTKLRTPSLSTARPVKKRKTAKRKPR